MLAVVCLASAPALAQVVIDPTRAEFNPSPDHDAVYGGTPMVWSYQFELYLVGDTTPFQVIDLGKPAGDPDGLIRIDLISVLNPLPPSGSPLAARVAAVGPGGTTRSDLSNPFAWSDSSLSPPQPPPPPPPEPPPPPPSEPPAPAPVLCSSYSLSRSAQSFSALAGTATVTVTAEAGCSWTVTDSSSWITISSGASGSGTGTVTYAVSTNTGTSPRSGTLTIGGVVLRVTQEGLPTGPPPAPGNLRFE